MIFVFLATYDLFTGHGVVKILCFYIFRISRGGSNDISPRGYPVNNGRNNIQWCQGGSNRNERTLIFDTPRTGIEREHDF